MSDADAWRVPTDFPPAPERPAEEHMPWTQADLAKLDPPYDIRFRPGQGGTMSPEWAAYMLNLWWAARDKKLAFAEAVKRTTVHFMVGEDA